MRKLQVLITLCVLITVQAFGQSSTKVNLKKLDKYYAQMAKDWQVPSVSIGIVKDGKLIFSGSYGVLEEGKKTKADANTLYAIASNSKAFTATVMGMLVEEGKLSWGTKVKSILPYFELYDPWVTNEVRIKDLLSHRVGLGTFSGDIIWHKSNLKSEEIIKRLKDLPPAFDFRDGFGYSNVMYITAGEVIKTVTGKSWGQNVKERILDPLGMNRTITSLKDLDKKGNYATPHSLVDNKNTPIVWESWEEIGAMGGVISSIEDISKWMIFNLNHGIHGKDTLFTKKTRNILWKPHNNYTVDHTKKNNFDRHFNGYGLGWGLSDYHGKLRVAHTGGYDGMLTSVSLIPDENLGIVVLTNGMRSPFMAATYYGLDKFLGLDTKDWSKNFLKNVTNNKDPRVADRKAKRKLNTKPLLELSAYTGTYKSDIYGDIIISKENNHLKLNFEHSPDLSATLEHWHYDVWKIVWDKKHAWFDFGTVKFTTDNNLKVKGIDFDVPNNDIYFEELKPYKVK